MVFVASGAAASPSRARAHHGPRHTAAGVIGLICGLAGAGAGFAQSPGEFVVLRDVPVHNAVTPSPEGAYVGIQMAPDMSIMDQVFGRSQIGGVVAITDEAAAQITSGVSGEGQVLSPNTTGAPDSLASDQFQLAGGSSEARGGLGGSIVGAINTGLAPLMGISGMLGGGR